MNIAIDALPLIDHNFTNRGVGLLTKHMLSHIFKNDTSNRYFLFNAYLDTKNADIQLLKLFDYPPNVTEQRFCFGYDFWAFRNDKYSTLFGKVVRKFIKDNEIDVFIHFSTIQAQVLFNPVWYENTYLISYFYDAIPFVFPDHYRKNDILNAKFDNNLSFISHSDKVIAISECSKKDFCGITNYNEDDVAIIYPATVFDYKSKSLETGNHSCLIKYGIGKEYILTVTGNEWRKNNEELIHAFSKTPKDLHNKTQLVIAGFFNTNSASYIQSFIDGMGLHDRIVLTGEVSDEELQELYSNAKAFVFVSKYEGFGLPIIEAMQYGIPVLTSNNSACAEIAGEAAILCDPFCTDDITSKLIYLLTEADCDELVKCGYERAKQFSYDISANRLLEIINSVDCQPKKEDRLKIALFSSLPPIVSGISDFACDLISDILPNYNVDIFVNDDYTPKLNILSNRIYNYKEFDSLASRYDLYFFQIGNNRYHVYEYNLIRKYGGIIELHDLDLYGPLKLHTIVPHSADFQNFKEFLSDDFDEKTINELISNIFIYNGIQKRPSAAVGFLANYADDIIIHSLCCKNELNKKGIDSQLVQLYKSVHPELVYESARNEFGFKKDEVIVLCSGIMNNSKRIKQILEAFSSIAKEKNAKLYLIGIINDDVLKNQIAFYTEKYENIVAISDVSTERMNQYIISSDIVLCCRYPDFMQTSANLICAARYGKCIVTSRVGWFDEIPDDCCIKIDSPAEISELEEIQQITEALKQLIENKNIRDIIACNMKKFANEFYDVKAIKTSYSNVIGQAKQSLYSKQFLEYLQDDFACYTPNIDLLDDFNKTVDYVWDSQSGVKTKHVEE